MKTQKALNASASSGLNELAGEFTISVTPYPGNSLAEMEKLVNEALREFEKRGITEEDIEEFVGVSKDFNVFELQSALARKDLAKSIRIIQYFESNPKAAPMQLVLPSLYSFFSKVFMVFGAGTSDEKAIATAIGVNSFFVKDYLQAAKVYNYQGIEKILLLLHQYNLKSIGINNAGTEDGSLLKELVCKMTA